MISFVVAVTEVQRNIEVTGRDVGLLYGESRYLTEGKGESRERLREVGRKCITTTY